MATVLIYSTHHYWGNHQAKELEIMESHRDNKDEIINIVCDRTLSICDVNMKGKLMKCLHCIEIRKSGKRIADIKAKEYPLFKVSNSFEGLSFGKDFENIEELKKCKIGNFDIGMAVVSSIIHYTLEPNIDLFKWQNQIKTLSKEAKQVYDAAIEYMNAFKPKVVYLFNGRFVHVRAILRAAELLNINYIVFEGGCDRYHYELYNNAIPHSIPYVTSKIHQMWDEINDVQMKRSIKFFEDRLNGKETNYLSFTNAHLNELPDNWDTTKTNIAIFNSSENEFEAIGDEWRNHIYNNQNHGIFSIVKDLESNQAIHFYLRIHPNLKDVKSSQLEFINNTLANFKNLTIISADSKISSYNLLLNADKIVTFGSSMGPEATYWGRVAIQAGKSFALNIDVVYVPQNHNEVIQLILEPLTPKPKENALKWSNYMANFGIEYKYYKPESYWIGKYRGYNIKKRISIYTNPKRVILQLKMNVKALRKKLLSR